MNIFKSDYFEKKSCVTRFNFIEAPETDVFGKTKTKLPDRS